MNLLIFRMKYLCEELEQMMQQSIYIHRPKASGIQTSRE